MSFRELTMIEIREVIRRWQAQQKLREAARETGLDRKTVRRYFAALDELGASRDGELDDELVQRAGALVQQARDAQEPSVERALLSEHRERIAQWLTAPKPLRLTKVHVLLHRDHSVDVSYATLRRFAMDELAWGARKPTVLVADAPAGEEAQVDFGLMGMMYDPQASRSRRLHVLVVTCCFSRYQSFGRRGSRPLSLFVRGSMQPGASSAASCRASSRTMLRPW